MTEGTEVTTDFAVNEWTAYRLANEADCQSPDSQESAGARFLTSIRDQIVDGWEYNDGQLDADGCDSLITETADNAPDVYTYTMWQEFVDLCAYQEDPTELGFDGSDMDQGARICLYMIAERCARAVMDALVSEAEEASEESDDNE